MRKHLKGFTLIEIAIFLAVTGALFVAITVGVQNSIYQQRYNDTVQSFANFLGNLYTEVINVQSTGTGRGDVAIYGKLVTFGENSQNEQSINVYNVIARAVNSSNIGSGSTLKILRDLDANVVLKGSDGKYDLVGIVDTYTPKWAAKIQSTSDFEDYVGALLIVRDARSGVVRTYAMNGVTIGVESAIASPLGDVNVFSYSEEGNYLENGFEIGEVDFCINPSGDEPYNSRTDVRVVAGAHDASGVEIISFDNEGNKCNK